MKIVYACGREYCPLRAPLRGWPLANKVTWHVVVSQCGEQQHLLVEVGFCILTVRLGLVMGGGGAQRTEWGGHAMGMGVGPSTSARRG